MRRTLVTGGVGFLGSAISEVLAQDKTRKVVAIDVAKPEEKRNYDIVVGDVMDFEFCKKILQDVDELVICHMAPHPYKDVSLAFDINVKGTVNLYEAALQYGIKRVVLVSSVQAMNGKSKDTEFSANHRVVTMNTYGLTKGCQEIIAESYYVGHGIETGAVRIGYVIDGEAMQDKYGNDLKVFEKGMIDRLDIGYAIKNIFDNIPANELKYEVFYLDGGTKTSETMDVLKACEKLSWKPKYYNERFDALKVH